MKLGKLVFILALVPLVGLLVCGCSDDDPADPDVDVTPPATVGDLIAYDATLNSIELSWTAPGDDENDGTATTYDIRYTTDGFRGDWDTATQVTGEPSPAAPGSNEIFVVTDLDEATEYTFALKTADEVPNWSDMSNTAVDTTLGSIIVTGGQAGWYSLVDVNTGVDLAHVQATGLQLRGEPSLGFQSRTLFILSPTGAGGANSAIYSCDPFTGDGMTQITDDDLLSVHSLDGSPVAPIIAFSASDTGTWAENIYTISESGGAPAQLTVLSQVFTLPGRLDVQILGASQPCWSPDGSRIAFLCGAHEVGIGGNRYDVVCVMDANGANLEAIYSQPLETAHYDTPCWTVDGNYVAFMQGSPEPGVIFVSMATGTAYNLWDDLDVFDYHPDMLTMDPWHMRVCYCLYESAPHLYIADLQTAGDVISASPPYKLTGDPPTGHSYGWPDWAPWSPIF